MISAKLGYDRDLFILPFDHRASFLEKLFGIKGRVPTDPEAAEVSSYKFIIYEGFKKALERGVPYESAGILVDEQFGSAILRDAQLRRIITAYPVERSGQDEFDFEYGTRFAEHAERFNPTFVKCLVRYNPEGDVEMNRRQLSRLKQLSDSCKKVARKFMFELLVPATSDQLKRFGGRVEKYDRDLRPELMMRAMAALQEGGVEPDVWKLEGIENVEDSERVLLQARAGSGRDRVGVIVLGRGENEEKVRQWLSVAAGVKGVIGFAVGRTVFWDALKAAKSGSISGEEASERIARNYKAFCDLWISARQSRKVA
ncbi:MAG: IolC myo-catabolism protein [Bdellovibrionales bacterium GWB1_55_8]|nr:MAG: IolC myo-catabolism protein [Bdellovibrionales bacterium GWB1_55_8]